MKVLFLHRDLPPDSFTGVAIQVHRLGNALADLGHHVTVITRSARPADARYAVRPAGGPWLRLALRLAPFLKRLWYPLWYRHAAATAFAGAFDAVHVHGDGGFLAYRKNFVRTFYGTAGLELRHSRGLKGRTAQGVSYLLERRESRLCAHSAGISPHIAEYLPKVGRVIPCMLSGDPDGAVPAKSVNPSLLFLGSRFSRKRGELALDIYRRLRADLPSLRLTYVGPAVDAEAGRADPALAGVDFRTRVEQEELIALYRSSWLYLCLSSYEGFGVGIIEAMAHGCAVFTTPHPGADFLVEHGKTGLVADPAQAEDTLREALGDATLRFALAARALEHSRRYLPRTVAEEYLALYREAAA